MDEREKTTQEFFLSLIIGAARVASFGINDLATLLAAISARLSY
jgi:hypothetical protein